MHRMADSDDLHRLAPRGTPAPISPARSSGKRSVLVGDETLLGRCGEVLRQRGHEIVAVVAAPGPAAEWATRAGVPLVARAADLLDADLGAIDYLFSITNLGVLPAEVLALASRAAINFHDGPLPAYAGLNTPVWALIAGEREHGVTWHLMTAQIDGGDILASEAVALDDGETALSVNTKCLEAGLRSFEALVADLDGALAQRRAQPCPPKRVYRRRDRPASAAMIDWHAPAEQIARFVSALDFGPYANPLGSPKALLGDRLVLVEQVEVLASRSAAAPGSLIAGGAAPVVSTGSNDIRLLRLTDCDGERIGQLDPAGHDAFTALDGIARCQLDALDAAAAGHEIWWRRRLAATDPLRLPAFRERASGVAGEPVVEDRALPATAGGIDPFTALVAYLGRVADRDGVDIGYSDPVHRSRLEQVGGWFAPQLPLCLTLDWNRPLAALEDTLTREIAGMHKRVGIARDLIARCPELRKDRRFAHPVAIQRVDTLDQAAADPATTLHIALCADGSACRWIYDAARLDRAAAEYLWRGFCAMLASADVAPETPLGQLSVLSPAEHARVVHAWNDTRVEGVATGAIHRLIVEQAGRTPDIVAVTSRGVSLTYAELDARSNRLARALAARGVGPEVMVGLAIERSVELVVCLLAIHKAGGAYVPLDPSYPAERLAHMITDSAMALIVSEGTIAGRLAAGDAAMLLIDDPALGLDPFADDAFDGGAEGGNLAYVIYTSGSTGLPKGVMVEHRQALNFFAGMDRHLDPEGVWLAVTSLNFDISLLELLWPLTRGYQVVVATEREVRGEVAAAAAVRRCGFSLFYFASSDTASQAEAYRLLLDGARYADANGFEAVWTPERHFHAFGAPYPNPSVAAAALAPATSRIAIRAGSVVAPLHHPVRIAEEWALVDNFSNGRVGIAFASGWQPNDFLLNPGNFADRNGALLRTIDDVRGLWRGEKRAYPGALGKDVDVQTFPRPVQPELPFWITSAGNPETFAQAGRVGANVLTHLLGQKVDDVAAKIAAYRAAWREAGHPGEGHVTLMLHTFVGEDAAAVREIVRRPLTEYLRTSTNLLQQYAWSFPAFKRPAGSDDAGQIALADLTPEETDALLDHAFERYFDTSGLFGTPESCVELVRLLRDKGVDEVGCLVDFGISTDAVLDNLPALNRLRQMIAADADGSESTLDTLMARHGVTHLQCTPSLLQVLAGDPAARARLAKLRHLMIGGEAFPPHLARDMTALIGGTVMNMYGPTETTVWSAVHPLDPAEDGAPPLGRPLANQQVCIVDRRLQPVRPGAAGELVIAGDGVTRGYWNRVELTAERFVPAPAIGATRAYRTGDLARQCADGTLEFLGRIDHQVKIRGHRIELGEIEATLGDHPQVREAVVVAETGEGGTRLLAYVAADGATIDELRQHLRGRLPEAMVPALIGLVEALPRTPNGKIDRKRLPDMQAVAAAAEPQATEPRNAVEARIQGVWADVLKLPKVGLNDNFFDLGGHSLLAVQVHHRLRAIAERPVALTDIFRFPTIAALAEHLAGAGAQPDAAREGVERAQTRRAALQRRGAVRAALRN
ncbi:MAG: MupA/Atu3671 family FMN-dependent luciferase-like monooxygenase [Novosphingobium sp.]